ncbi:MAG: ATP-binding protein [Candidatus Neomarinimicrobiota bacterium]
MLSISLVFFSLLAYVVFSVNRNQSEKIIRQCGNRVSFIINRALHKSMLINDNTELREIIVELTKLSGLLQIDIYDQQGNLKHATGQLSGLESEQNIAEKIEQIHHQIDAESYSPEQFYTISRIGNIGRILKLSTPILNEPNCTNTACHIHSGDDPILGLLQIKLSLSEIDKTRASSEIYYFALVSVFILASIIIMVTFTERTIHRPMAHIVRASNEVAKGNLDIRIPVQDFKDADVSHVGTAFNNMLDELGQANKKLRRWSKDLEETVRIKTEEIKRTQNELIRIERMASLGKLSSSVAHEINNPLSGVLTYSKLVARLLKKDPVDPEDMQNIFGYLEMIESETKRCGNIVKGLLDFSRQEPSRHEIVPLNSILVETQTLMEHSFKVAQVDFETDFSAIADLIQCNPNQIKQICIAVLVNAIEAITREGRVTFTSGNNDDLSEVNITITDNGSGIRSEDKDHIFEPFFTRKKDGAGSGLGLAVTYGIVQRHKGRIEVESELTKGTKFVITLPVYTKTKDISNAG